MRPTLSFVLAAAFAAQALNAFTPTEDGLYAVFDTSKGEFAAQLDFARAPLTVANFVGLAEGSIPRIDPDSKELKLDPFYDGLRFHRVIKNFMIQSGDPNGDDLASKTKIRGPGYSIPNEMHPFLDHSRPGTLGMANAGFNSGGSQFYVTLDPGSNTAPFHLDGHYSVFGHIVSGMPIVESIGAVAVDALDQPSEPVVLNSVRILRRGNDAEEFYAVKNAYNLPSLAPVPVRQTLAGARPAMELKGEKGRNYYYGRSANLLDWNYSRLFAEGEGETTFNLDLQELIADSNALFLNAVRIAPMNGITDMTDWSYRAVLSGVTWEYLFTDSTEGLYRVNNSPVGEAVYTWIDLPNGAQLDVYSDNNFLITHYVLPGENPLEGVVFAIIENLNTGSSNNSLGTFSMLPPPEE